MTLVKWALPQLSELLPLDEESLKEIILYTNTLSDAEATISQVYWETRQRLRSLSHLLTRIAQL
jgi:recombinational DNA repair protein RecR